MAGEMSGNKIILARLKIKKACVKNENCDVDSVCYEGVCQKCLGCSLVFRKGKSCKRDFSDCGDCLKGFYEVPITTYSSSKPCMTSEMLEFDHSDKVWFLFISIFILHFVGMFYLFYKKFYKKFNQNTELKKINAVSSSLLNSNQHTDLYEPSAPELPQNETTSDYYCNFPHTFHFEYLHRKLNEDKHLDVEFESGEMQNAKVYQTPTAEYYLPEEELEESINTPHTNNNTNAFGPEENNESRLSSFSEQDRDELNGREESSQPIREENVSNLPVVEGEANSSATYRNVESNEELND